MRSGLGLDPAAHRLAESRGFGIPRALAARPATRGGRLAATPGRPRDHITRVRGISRGIWALEGPGRPSGLPRARLEIAPGRPRAHIMGIRGHIAGVRRPEALAARPAFRGGRPEIGTDPV